MRLLTLLIANCSLFTVFAQEPVQSDSVLSDLQSSSKREQSSLLFAECSRDKTKSNPTERATKDWLLGVGHNALLDIYLSQEHYSGVELNLLHVMTKQLKSPHWSRTHTYSLSLASTQPRSDAATDYVAMFDYSFGMHRCVLAQGNPLHLSLGAQADAYIGGIYNNRNGNNPGQLKLGADIGPSVHCDIPLGTSARVRADYTASFPLIGLEFSPAYGQSYYEIFTRDNYDHNVCLTSPLSAVNFTQRLLVHIPLCGRSSGACVRALSLGYLFRCRQSAHNSLKYHSYTHSFLIGITL